ncbi:MAG: DUF2155 domain-containing protein [Rickettsiales bacterium]|jgi:hypothetical protein|nr:DUF2155 domain-containing protein [Rickettsiales bacterium]
MFRILFTTLLIFLSSLSIANEEQQEEVIQNTTFEEEFANNKQYATIQILNKITAKTKYMDIKVNEENSFGPIKIKVLSCWKASPYDLSENKILLNISEKKIGTKEYENIFEGWMFSSSPAISTMEHPIYDVIAINCHDN